jgi:hypothetical protein
MNKNGNVVAAFDKEGKKGYRIRDEQGNEQWYTLDDKIVKYYNPELKNKQVEFNSIEVVEGKTKRAVLTFIKESDGIKEVPTENKEYFSNEHQGKTYTDEEKREMARNFANIRHQSLDIALRLYPEIKTMVELVSKSKEIEEYIKSG